MVKKDQEREKRCEGEEEITLDEIEQQIKAGKIKYGTLDPEIKRKRFFSINILFRLNVQTIAQRILKGPVPAERSKKRDKRARMSKENIGAPSGIINPTNHK